MNALSQPDENNGSLDSQQLIQHDSTFSNLNQYIHEDTVSTAYTQNAINPEEKSQLCQFKWYILWNSIRFMIISIIICYANYQNQYQIDGYQPYCCACYYIAKNQSAYGIDHNYRIDWSYCMPQCVDCNYCNHTFKNNGIMHYIYPNKSVLMHFHIQKQMKYSHSSI